MGSGGRRRERFIPCLTPLDGNERSGVSQDRYTIIHQEVSDEQQET